MSGIKYCPKVEDWFSPIHKGFRFKCCDCALIHEVDFEVRKGEVFMRMRRHERATAAARRNRKKRVLQIDG